MRPYEAAFIEAPEPRWGEASSYMDAMHSLCVECHEREAMKDPEEHPEDLNRCMTCHDVDWREDVKQLMPRREADNRLVGVPASSSTPSGR